MHSFSAAERSPGIPKFYHTRKTRYQGCNQERGTGVRSRELGESNVADTVRVWVQASPLREAVPSLFGSSQSVSFLFLANK